MNKRKFYNVFSLTESFEMQKKIYSIITVFILVALMVQGHSQIASGNPVDCLHPVDTQISGFDISCAGNSTGRVKAAAVIFLQDFEGLEGSFRNPTRVIPGAPGLRYENDSNAGRLQFRNDFVFRETTMASLDNPGGESVNWLIQQIDLSAYQGATDLVLDFWWYDHGDEGDAPDIVEIRGDNTQPWIEVYDFATNSNNGSWSYANIDLDEALGNQILGTTIEIRIGQNDNFPINTEGISIDDLAIFREGQTYSFEWTPGDNTTVPQPVSGSFYYSTVDNLPTGTYTVTITDGSGCTNTASVTIENNNILTAVCDDITVTLDINGQTSLLPSEVGSNSITECGLESESLSKTFFDCTDVGTVTTVTYSITDVSGKSDNCTANVTVDLGDTDVLPDGWSTNDIGFNPQGTDYSFDFCSNNGEFTISGSGNNATSSTTDNVAFASQSLCGDGSITAKIESVSPNGYGGLMIRESTADGAKQVSIFSNLSNSLRHETRYAMNGFKQVSGFFKPSPFWLRLERQGDWVFAYCSTNGVNFQNVHGVFVPMQNCVEIGLSSFTFLPNNQTDAVFANVEVVGSNGAMGDNIAGEIIHEAQKTSFNTNSHAVSIFPNPASNHVNIQLEQGLEEEAQIQLFNQYGQLLAHRNIQSAVSQIEWDLSDLVSGNYILRLESKSRQVIMNRKLVIVKE